MRLLKINMKNIICIFSSIVVFMLVFVTAQGQERQPDNSVIKFPELSEAGGQTREDVVEDTVNGREKLLSFTDSKGETFLIAIAPDKTTATAFTTVNNETVVYTVTNSQEKITYIDSEGGEIPIFARDLSDDQEFAVEFTDSKENTVSF